MLAIGVLFLELVVGVCAFGGRSVLAADEPLREIGKFARMSAQNGTSAKEAAPPPQPSLRPEPPSALIEGGCSLGQRVTAAGQLRLAAPSKHR
jgi:hypothetical protein